MLLKQQSCSYRSTIIDMRKPSHVRVMLNKSMSMNILDSLPPKQVSLNSIDG